MNPGNFSATSAAEPNGLLERWRTSQFSRWLFQHRGSESEALLYHRRIFTLPSRAGLVFGLMLLALLIGAINYQLSLGYLLAFWVASMAWVGLHLSFANLSGLRFSNAQAQPVFAGEQAAFEFEVEDTRKRARYAVRVSCGASESRFHIAAQGQRRALFLVPTRERGWLQAPRATIDSQFPLGLWRAWAYWQPAAKCLVYPAPEKNPPPLPTSGEGEGDAEGGKQGNDNFAFVRPYQQGDSIRRIAWKTAARSDGDFISTKVFEGGASQDIWLNWNLTGTQNEALRLSRLTAWVLKADELGLDYGLRLCGMEIAPNHGEAHRAECLKALALC
ncbi:MAG: DUF58 domain-containing protein [Burkholderiales bacterium]|jgi:uncharacterized protein (DUF58 family)|nr:DUF58 domain-containing protein [Burkholderiales bacterium]MCA3161328.1 DUF58 domain-containing protein [Burkholderiales bacterium]MCA3163400.1 DUF58 domain-containing protein [Burkholderiales bacterium]MCA3165140.1 DUF58 domain-containing protein [Burkholderiales bacterium]MCA3170290.1 DUF58 domain-containing protein [Burkholderiales bacterium]